MKTLLKILAGFAALLAVLALPFALEHDQARAIVASATIFIGVVAGVLVGAALNVLHRNRRIRDASRALARPHIVAAAGFATHARGWIDEDLVVISAKGAELDAAERVRLLDARELKRLARDPERLAANLREAIRLHRANALVRGAAPASTCPYCKDQLAARDAEGTVRCPSCESLHHTTCWQEHGGCSVHGCARVPGEKASRVRE